MTYQIPQQLQYKEKIMFGLTFKQLAYLFGFALLGILFLKKISSTYVSFPLITLTSIVGIMFIFFDLDLLVKNYIYFFRNRVLLGKTPKMQNIVDVKEIKENLIVTNKGNKIAVLRVSPINFSIKTEEEKESIIYSFQKFLNSLDFSTQILMNTEAINLDEYLNALKSKNDEEYKTLFQDYKNHLHNLITNNKLMDRVFYLIIREQTNIEIQVDVCLDRLRTMNLKVERLRDKTLTDFLSTFFCSSKKNSFQPKEIKNFHNYLEIDGEFKRIIYASGYPRNVESGFLDRIVSSLADFNLSIHIKPYPIDRMLVDLNKQLQKQRADLYTMQQKGISNPSLEIQNTDTRYTLENLQKGEERLFNVSLYIVCKAGSVKELDFLTKKVESELNSLMIMPRVAELRSLQGLKSCLPFGVDFLNENRNITTKALSAFFPFTSQFLQVDNGGVWLGMNKNNIPIIKDIFKLPNPNGLVLAQSGGGKSYFCKLLITRYLLNGTRVMIIDPQGEYKSLVSHFGGQRIDLSRDSDSMINPLDMMGHDYAEKRLSLIDLMQIMLGKMSDPQKAIIDKAISETYRLKGINDDPSTWNNTPPILQDLLKALEKIEKEASQIERTTITSLVNRLSMYVSGVFKFMNKHTSVEFDNKLVCFDIGNLPKQVKPSIMFMVLDYIYMKMKSDLSRKLLLIDESWSLLSRAEDAGYIFEIVKTCRKFNMGLLMINQEVEGLFTTPAGKSVLANSAYTLLMRQKPAVIADICKTFNLSDSEKQHLLTCAIGEGLLLMEDDHSKIKIISSPEEHKIITTNADEILVSDQNKPVGKNVKIRIDSSKGIFKYNKLSSDEKKYLEEVGYKASDHKSILTNKKEKYMLRPCSNESANHFFVIQDIKLFLEKKGIKVETFNTKKPDLVFEHKGKTYAIEVETGKKIEKDRKQIVNKVEELNKNYKNWFFVVLNTANVSLYRKFGHTIDARYLKEKLKSVVG